MSIRAMFAKPYEIWIVMILELLNDGLENGDMDNEVISYYGMDAYIIKKQIGKYSRDTITLPEKVKSYAVAIWINQGCYFWLTLEEEADYDQFVIEARASQNQNQNKDKVKANVKN